MVTLETDSFPRIFNILVACLLKASIDLRSGVFLSSVPPVYEQKAVGIKSVPSLIKEGEGAIPGCVAPSLKSAS